MCLSYCVIIVAMGEGKHVDSFYWLKQCIMIIIWLTNHNLLPFTRLL